MSESFSFKITLTPEQAVERAREGAKRQGADFQGDAKRGTFSAMGVAGDYTITGDVIEVTITERPFFAPLSIVESKIKSLFV